MISGWGVSHGRINSALRGANRHSRENTFSPSVGSNSFDQMDPGLRRDDGGHSFRDDGEYGVRMGRDEGSKPRQQPARDTDPVRRTSCLISRCIRRLRCHGSMPVDRWLCAPRLSAGFAFFVSPSVRKGSQFPLRVPRVYVVSISSQKTLVSGGMGMGGVEGAENI